MDLDTLINDVKQIGMLQDAVDPHYDIVELTKGKVADRGKFKLTKNDFHGGRNKPETINALMMAFRSELNDGNVLQRPGMTGAERELRMAGSRFLAPAGASELAKVGLRAGAVEQLDGAERLERALDRVNELDKGYNPVTGAFYGDVGLDGGHKLAHAKHHDASARRDNMMFESKYENRAKGAAEGEDIQSRIKNSLMKRLKSGEISPLQLVNSVNARGPIRNRF